MTEDVVALTERMPDVWSLMAGLTSAGPDAGMATVADGAMIQLCDAGGRPLASVEAPMLIWVPGEAARLLGADVEGPVWWTEVRAATAAQNAGRLAGTIASRLVGRLGGTVWPPEAAPPDGGASAVRDVATASAPAAAQPAVDVLTEHTAVVISGRPAVATTAWLSDALRAARSSGRALQIVTPPDARLTLPTRTLLSGLPNRWVVNDGEGGYFDGLSGAELHWQDGTFASTGRPAPVFLDAEPSDETQLVVSFRTRQRADRELLLGGALEAVWQRLAGQPPAGWGTAEPAGQTWSRHELTDFARERAPRSTWTVVVGHPSRPALATLRVDVTTGGVGEEVTLAFGYPAGEEPPLDALPDLACCLAVEHGLVSMLVQRRTARADLTVPPRREEPPVPLAFALGCDDVRTVGVTRARRPPLPDRPVQLGPLDSAGFYYPLPDGDPVAAWEALQKLTAYLGNSHEQSDSSGQGAAGAS